MKTPILFPIIILLSILTFFSCNDDDDITIPQQPPITTAAELTAALTTILDDSDAPGFAVSIVKNDNVLYQQSFGQADIENNQEYTNQTVQPIGSISKTFIAATVVKAIEQGHFTLDTDINDILPVEVHNPKQPDAIIQVRHLVTHTSGLIDESDAYFQAYHILPGEDLSTVGAELLINSFGLQQRETLPLDEFLVEYYLEDGDLYSMDNFAATEPGTTWAYSNIASSLAAYLVEVATETPFRTYVSTNILQPLGMDQTAYDVAELDPSQVAKLYWDKNTPLPHYYNESYPDGSIITSNEDLAKYLSEMMKGARGESSTLFSPAGYELLFDALLPAGSIPAGLGENQGVFWLLGAGKIRHDGSDPGTTCVIEFDAAGEAGYLLLTNMDASTAEHERAYFNVARKVGSAIDAFIAAN